MNYTYKNFELNFIVIFCTTNIIMRYASKTIKVGHITQIETKCIFLIKL